MNLKRQFAVRRMLRYSGTAKAKNVMSTKILLDTDIGSDIDDAVAFAYLLAQPQCQLLGITTVTAEAEKRAMLASALCMAAGKDVPIFPGAEKPLIVPQNEARATQARALKNWNHRKDFPKVQAVEFMRKTVHENPGEIILLTIGPLTNIALLFAVDPEIPSLLKGLVMMCGVFTNRIAGVGPTEYNAAVDPHATAMVYGARVAVHRSIGLDVTCRVRMDAKEVRERFSSGLLRPVLDFAEVYFENAREIIFHDPLAGATIFDDEICAFDKGKVEVELASERLKGLTHWRSGGPDAPHEAAVRVNADRFFEHYFSVVEKNS